MDNRTQQIMQSLKGKVGGLTTANSKLKTAVGKYRSQAKDIEDLNDLLINKGAAIETLMKDNREYCEVLEKNKVLISDLHKDRNALNAKLNEKNDVINSLNGSIEIYRSNAKKHTFTIIDIEKKNKKLNRQANILLASSLFFFGISFFLFLLRTFFNN